VISTSIKFAFMIARMIGTLNDPPAARMTCGTSRMMSRGTDMVRSLIS